MNKKNILFIYISFFNYHEAIEEVLSAKGFNVIKFDERMSNHKLIKTLYRYFKSFRQLLSYFHFKSILKQLSSYHEMKYLFVLKGEVTPIWFLKRIKEIYPDIITIYYTWDSFENNSNGLKLMSEFQKCYTFDHKDALEYDISFRPLFAINKITCEYLMKASSVFTVHSDRLIIFSKIKKALNNYNIEVSYYAYSRFILYDFLKERIFNCLNLKMNRKPLSLNQMQKFQSNSSIIIDINHPRQSGLTMRNFEVLSNNQKLITTNKNIKKYIFYNENNICVIDRDNLEIPKHFMESEFSQYDESIYYSMSLNGFIDEIFFDKKILWLNEN